MAESPKTKDLLLLITGLHVQTSPPTNATSGKDYWLKQSTSTDDRILRESKFNDNWLSSPEAAWDSVRYRDWLAATLFAEIAKKSDFVAISESLLASIDVVSKDFTHDMKDISESILAALKSRDGRARSLLNTLSVGISRHKNTQGKEVFLLGAGIRRRARFWKTESVAIQADAEVFVPFWEIPNSESPRQTEHFYSVNAGIALSHSDGSPIDKDAESNKELIAVRFNLRMPFYTQWSHDETRVETVFENPVIKIQKRIRENTQSIPTEWIPFTGWQKFLEAFCEKNDGRELLNVPIGPLLLEKMDSASVQDILLQADQLKAIKTDLAESYKEFNQTMDLLDNIWKVKARENEDGEPHTGQRKLGNLLESLGFMTSKPPSGGQYKYEFNIAKDLTVWDVINRIIDELDGSPIYVKGAKPKKKNEPRIAVSLASQRSETEAGKNYFGLAGLIYNIALKTVPPDAPAKKDKDDDGPWIAVSKDNFAKDENIFLEADEDEEEDQQPKPKPEENPEGKSTVEVFLHLGKWFSNETIDDNWYKRLLPLPPNQQQPRIPIPGIRLLPITRTSGVQPTGAKRADFAWTLRGDLVSLGIDIKGSTKNGLIFLQKLAGLFGLGAVEIRLAVSIRPEIIYSDKEWWEKCSIGFGVKLKDLRLSFGPKENDGKQEDEKEKDIRRDKAYGDDILLGIQNILSDEWLAEIAPEKSQDRKPKTRLSYKKKDKFSISFGYLTQLTKDSKGTLDVQLYDARGNRGKLALIPIDRSLKVVYIRQIGIGLKGIENLELSGGLPDEAQLTVAITGGIRTSVFELGLIGAKLIFQLNNISGRPGFELDGLDVSIKIGSVVISGSFFKAGIEYAGMLTVDFPKVSFSAMGFYGSLRVLHVKRDNEIISDLNAGKLHADLNAKLLEKNIRAAGPTPIKKGNAKDEWELYASDNTLYTITDDDDKLNVLRPEKTFFVYAMLNAASGAGPTIGPIQFTGIALGYGYNRRLKVPTIETVARFPLVRMVMGDGGYQQDGTTIATQLGKPLEDPVWMLEKLKDHVVGEAGQQFACAGVRFTVSGIIDCFALVVVQWGEGDIELSMLGLSRFRHPRDPKTAPICYVEMQMLMTFKPREGTFQLQALLTTNSWIINKDCKLTGGFALFVWFDGKHKGDWVITFGGYHPRFVRPAHYPIVPRIGLNWRVNNNLTMKGSMYLAITPSCGMLGARLEAAFHSGRVSAWYTAYLDVIVNWQPLYFEAEIGISLRVHVSLWITSLKVSIGVNLRLWGPPVGGIAHIDLSVISFDIPFGEKLKEPELVKTWPQFCNNFLNMNGSETPAANAAEPAFPVVQANLAGGRNNLSNLPNSRRKQPSNKRDDDVWIVRGDELELAASTVVPVSNVNVGTVRTNSPPQGVQSTSFSGKPMMVSQPLALESKALLRTKNKATQKFGVHPMGKTMESVLNVTVVEDQVSGEARAWNMAGWTMEEEISALPAALWDPAKPNFRPTEPSAKLIDGCITGIKKLKPPPGKLGNKFEPPPIQWHKLEPRNVPRSVTPQNIPVATVSRNISPLVVEKQDNQKNVVAALSAAGFNLTWQPAPVAEVHFRELQADPLAGSVAA